MFTTMHPKFQGAKYRLFRALMFVTTGLFGLAPLIHGLIVFGTPQMMNKALPYTLTKAGCLICGTSFYAVCLPILRTKEMPLAHVILDQISRESISWQIRPVGLPFNLPHPGCMRSCGPADRVSGCLRLRQCKFDLLVPLSDVYALWNDSNRWILCLAGVTSWGVRSEGSLSKKLAESWRIIE